MRSTKLRWKVLAGMLCAAMVFQSVPAQAVAGEAAETAQSYDIEGSQTTQEQEVQAETDSALAAPEDDTAGDSLKDTGDVSETSETVETAKTTEMPDVAETSETTETPDSSEAPTVSETPETTGTSDTAGRGESADMTESGTQDDMTEVSETESDSTEEESEEEITLLADERPDYKKLFSVVSEDRYFYYGDVKEIFVTVKGCEIEEDVAIEFYIDSDPEEAPSSAVRWEKQGDYYVISLPENTSVGQHVLTYRLVDTNTNGEVLAANSFNFTTEEAGVFTEADKYYISATDDNIEVTILNPRGSLEIESVQITASNGDIVARFAGESTPKPVPLREDPRYEIIGDGYQYSEDILYKTTWVLPTEKNSLEIGNYDIRLTLANGSDMLLSNAVEVSAKAVVTKCTLGTDYDNTNNFVYLYIQGSGFNPSQIRFDFEDEATSAILSTTRIDYKTVQSGYIVKFRKEGNWDKAGKKIKVTISTRSGSGNVNFTQTEFEADLESGIYYAEYNRVLSAVEVGVTTDLNNNAVSFRIVDNKDNPSLVSTVISRSLTESLVYLTPNESLTPGETYYVELRAGGNPYYKEFIVNTGEPSTNHWEASSVISKNAERHDFYYYSTDAVSNDGLSASIDGYSGDVAVYASEWLREDGAKGSRIQVWIPTLKLSPGQYTVRIASNGVALSSRSFQVVASDYAQFVLDTYSLSWIDDNTIQAYIKTSNCAETDDFDIKLTGIEDGNAIEINTAVTERYTDSVYMNITGLDRRSAYKDYYVLITHKKYGLPVQMSDVGKQYYDDETKGERKSIFSNKGLPVLSNNRIIGINIQNLALPAKLTLYATNSTDVITSITIPSTVEGNYYYFTKEFYDSLEKKDRLYDMTISDFGENWGRSYAKVNIGYKDETVVNDIDVQITSDVLYIDGAESGKSAVITVSKNTQKPVFEVSDDEIVGLEDYIEPSDETQSPDPNKKLVVAKATGTTEITIIADGVKKNIFITVTRRASGISLNTSDRNMKVGDSFEAEAYILPRSAEDSTQIVKFISSNNDILYVRQLTNTTAKVTARRAGTAVLRATLEGTTYTVAVNVSITDSLPLYDKKEIKIKEVGTVYYIENVDRSLQYCELPEGWKWKDGDLSLTAGEELQHCWATYTEEGYQPFSARLPVAVIRISGINVTGRSLINRGQKEEYQITYEYVGANIDTDKVRERLELKCNRTTDENIAVLETLDWDSLVIAALEDTEGGTAKFALTLSIDNGTNEGTDLFTKEFSVNVPVTDCVNSVKVVPVKAGGQTFDYKENDDLMEVDVNEVKTAQNKYSVELTAKASINGVQKDNVNFSWQTSDQAIATVALNKDGAVILTIKQAGYVEITAVAEDAGQCTGTLAVNIVEYAPVLETTSVTVNRYAVGGAEVVLQEQNGNMITSVRVLEDDKDSQNFSVSVPVNGIAALRIRENAPVLGYTRKTVSNCKLEARTSKGNYTYNIKITTDVTKPTAAVKVKTKANLFYTDAEAVYTVTSKYDILSVENVIGENDSAVRFYGDYDRNSNTIRFNTRNTLTGSTLSQFTNSKSPSVNVRLRITFAGYSEPQILNVRVATENKKPSLSMTGMVTCPGLSEGTVTVVDSKTKAAVPLSADSMTIRVVKPENNFISTQIRRNGSVSMEYSVPRSISYTAELTSRSWTQAVNAKGKITYVNAPEKMALALGSKQLTMNMDTSIAKNEATIPVSVSGSDIDINRITYDGTAKDKLIDAGYLSVDFSAKNKTLGLRLNGEKGGNIKAGSYKLNLYATVNIADTEVEIKKATLTIKLTGVGAVKVALRSPKGKINLVDRANTSVVYTPKLSGIDSNIESVSVADGAEYFTAALNSDNKVEVKAKTGKNMSSSMAYDVTIISTLHNGYQVPTTVKIKPANTYPKIALSPAKCSLYRANSNKYTVSVSLTNSNIDLDNIIGIKIDTGTNGNASNFFLINNISKNGTVTFDLAGERNHVDKGKYTVKCLVTFRDAAINANPAAVNMVITVK